MASTVGQHQDGSGCGIGLEPRGYQQDYPSSFSSSQSIYTASSSISGVSSDDGATEPWQNGFQGLDIDHWDESLEFSDHFGSDTMFSRSSSYQGDPTSDYGLSEASTVPMSPGLTRLKVPTDYHTYGHGPKGFPPGLYILAFNAHHVFWQLQSRQDDPNLPETIIIGPCPVEYIYEEGQEPPQPQDKHSAQSQQPKEQKKSACGSCEATFTRAADRDRHETSVHKHEKCWTCSERSCPRFKKVFFRKDHGLVHVRITHKNRKGVELMPISPVGTIDDSARLRGEASGFTI